MAYLIFAAVVLGFSLLSCYYSLQEWNSTEVQYDNYINKIMDAPPTAPIWLIYRRPARMNQGRLTHSHQYYDADGFKHMVTYGNLWKWPNIYYITKHEDPQWFLPLTYYTGGQRQLHSFTTKEKKNYYINYTATHKSSYVTYDGQADDYDKFWKFWRALWWWNDTSYYKNFNQSAEHIYGPFMLTRFVRRGSLVGKHDKHWPVPSRGFWEGLVVNLGHRLTWSFSNYRSKHAYMPHYPLYPHYHPRYFKDWEHDEHDIEWAEPDTNEVGEDDEFDIG